jgi:methylase of polypeptide subunit release factors
MSPGFLFADRPDDIVRVRESLDQAGYTQANAHRILGDNVLVMQGFVFLAAGDLTPHVHRTGGGSPLETLIRLFLLGVDVDLSHATQALAPLGPEVWAEAGLVAIRSSRVTGLVRLLPYEAGGDDWIVAYDSSARRRHQAADFVIGVGLASCTLASMTVRPHVERCLDLGTGNGVQAVHAHQHADVVVATDRNARAVAFAAFTAALNRIANVTAREGSLFDPIQGEQFGLIVSNPPFIISPEASFAWRDGGLPLDGLCRRIVAEAPAHLERDGWCQLLANWVHPGDGDWRQRLAGWFEGTGCNVWVIQRQVQDAERYAAGWIGYEGLDATRAKEAFDAWMEHYRQADVAAVGYGLITMRRSSGAAPWVRIDELTQDFEVPCGDAIQAGFERFTWLADVGHDNRRLLAARLRAADDVRLDERRVLCAGSWESRKAELRLAHGLRQERPADPEAAAVVAGCNGSSALGQVLEGVASSAGSNPTSIAARAVPIVRNLIEQGFLVPDGPG